MKTVTMIQGETSSTRIKEADLSKITGDDTWKVVPTKGEYELIRQQHSSDEKSWRFIYQKNKRDRSMTNWMTPRVIYQLRDRYPQLGTAILGRSVKLDGIELSSTGSFGPDILLEVIYRRVSAYV